MAEEKNKKIIIASDDSDDEHSGDTASDEQTTDLSTILDKLTLGPKKQKKKLMVLSLNGLLLHRVHIKNMCKKPKNRTPDASCGPNLVYKRPFAEEFMKFCLERYEVGIWSSACELDQEKCTDSGFKTLENGAKPMFFKDLSKVFKCFQGFSASNTIFIDEEPYKALLNPDHTGLFPFSYDANDKKDDLLDPERKFCAYLDDLANASDVQAYIKEHSFGQSMIDSSHPDWSFYSKVSKIVSYLA
ncbi:hypothetical protein EUTSA_v10027102mg [Eutrema salsugineum]|uniref:Mitochondrial import inner membrane translocase subunit TIM50 n=1 Tax=Eutrema salsugineum TaxID=72664 RepID=V4LZQ8_EUTSA|nr:uncharacterized protein LOC18029347 [Eutrema salsugineum]ESQ56165.1 hypothetical protein EUTSA_v10027102mg [Eutrema salsugineum]